MSKDSGRCNNCALNDVRRSILNPGNNSLEICNRFSQMGVTIGETEEALFWCQAHLHSIGPTNISN